MVTPETPRRIRRGLLATPPVLLTTPEATRCAEPLGSLAMNRSQQAHPTGPASLPSRGADPPASGLPASIDELWEARAGLTPDDEQARAIVVGAVDAIDAGQARVAWPDEASGEIVVDERAKRAILLAFRLLPMIRSQVGDFRYHDRVPLTAHLDGVRAVPGAIVRWGAYVAPGAVLMPSFVNIGAYVDTGTMVDTWATVGSCAQIGKNVHLSGGVGIGGVLEPPNAVPVVVEDDAHIGSRSMVVEGARVRQGAVLGAGTILTRTTHVIDVGTGDELPRGEVPAWSVCVGGTRPRKFPGGEFGMPCVLVLKRLPEGSGHDKAALNEILRDHGVTG
jgi:2,3,4,5-tetrahydropyridine-2,6-dicarboxylate N-succinyltransferase